MHLECGATIKMYLEFYTRESSWNLNTTHSSRCNLNLTYSLHINQDITWMLLRNLNNGVWVCHILVVMFWDTELKLGMGVGGALSFVCNKGQRSFRDQFALEMRLWLPNLVRRTPGQSVVCCWGLRFCRHGRGQNFGELVRRTPD